jgi:hypothetical protein
MIKNDRARYDDDIVLRQRIMQMHGWCEVHIDDLTRQILQPRVRCEAALDLCGVMPREHKPVVQTGLVACEQGSLP